MTKNGRGRIESLGGMHDPPGRPIKPSRFYRHAGLTRRHATHQIAIAR